jgi:D-alanine-D-alanine ligase
MKKIRVGIIFGGKSSEHEVSLQSAKSVYEAIDKDKFEIVLIGIDKKGQWAYYDTNKYLVNSNNPKTIMLDSPLNSLQLTSSLKQPVIPVDVIFPVMHGANGEDGTMQGLLKIIGIPFVGASVLGSAIGMDKDVAKRLLRDAKLPIGKFLTFRKNDRINFDDVVSEIGLPFFVKPANSGSSVGINKVHKQEEFDQFVKEAFKHDNKILCEEFIKGREIECSVLGNENPTASLPGEVIPTHEFYDYDAKYIDVNGAKLVYPAKLDKSTIKSVQELALKIFKVLELSSMARIDFFLTEDGKLFINEVNTIPGFTKISMYPKLWEVSGLPYPKLIEKLIDLALEKHKSEMQVSKH